MNAIIELRSLRHLPDVALMRLHLLTLAVPQRTSDDLELLDALGREWNRRKGPIGLATNPTRPSWLYAA